MNKSCLAFATVLTGIAGFVGFASAQDPKLVSEPPTSQVDKKEADYVKKIEARTSDILAVLGLTDSARSARVHDAIIAQYRGLKTWHDTNDAKLKQLKKQLAGPDKDQRSYAESQVAQIQASLKTLHDHFLSSLSAELTPEQVEKVKDKMTYNKVQVTYSGYYDIVPNLTEAQKARILELLKQAREEAMDAGSADEKSAVFKQYKGKINNYLSAQGHDVAKAYKDWAQAQKARSAAKPTQPDPFESGATGENTHASSVNSVGMKMVYISPGSFTMGAETATFDLGAKTAESKDAPSWDETPRHKVNITKGFRMSEEEVTVTQFRHFRRDFQPTAYFAPYATGVSWHDATEFCQWLSKKEGKNYRLPTEAEWEYACRAGATTLFWSGGTLPREDVNPWGLKNMHSGPAEWCYDWHGEYSATEQTDPVGYDAGWARVVRGGAVRTLEVKGVPGENGVAPDTSPVWYRCANRCSLMPDTPKFEQGEVFHFVGFRVVEAEFPKTKPLKWIPELPLEGVKQSPADWTAAPDLRKPYFKARVVMPSPPDFTQDKQCAAVGFSPAVQGKVHSGGITYCPNGDLLAISFSSLPGKSESAPNTSMVVTRLRRGAEEWDMPELFYKLSGLNDQSGLLWNDQGTLWFFGGGRDLGQVPFRFTRSKDGGATWSDLKPAVIVGELGPFTAQPINSAFREPDGTIYVASDAKGATSLLFASKDEGKTWRDTGGRTVGRHTTFVLLKDGRILGMGGKDSAIDRYMPMCFSRDFGKTWTAAEKTPFAAVGSNQRPKILRLASGRLFFAGDFQNIRMLKSPPPDAIKERGAYVALSDDEAKTWHIKKLAMATPHNGWKGVVPRTGKPQHGYGTLGYCDAVQAPDGLIHLMTSKGSPSMHFAMNEAWILSDETGETGKTADASGRKVVKEQNRWPNGKARVAWSWFKAKEGTPVLHGKETWSYESGAKQYEVTRENGKKLGSEQYFRPDGSKQWTREYKPDGTLVWTSYWSNGAKKSESHWRGSWAQGVTRNWTPDGKLVQEITFKDGRDLSADDASLGDD